MRFLLPTALGVAVSVLLPVLAAAVQTAFSPRKEGARAFGGVVWTVFKPYALLGVFSVVTALLVVAYLGDTLADARAAILAGYAWDATLQKIAKPQ